ncbi:MAG: hypothetical protein ACFE9L_19105, partial [Candidatus Hodarchaeota archaeon]
HPPNDGVDTNTKRQALSERFEAHRTNYLGTRTFHTLPFLWFSVDYFWNANLDLLTTDFHATSFYEYLVKQLRGHSGVTGAYHLIREGVTLSDLRWEKLQYISSRLITPLTTKQFQAITAIYSLIVTDGIDALQSKQMRAVIQKHVESRAFILNLSRWFKLLDTRWRLHYFPPAFGLEIFFFHFQLENISLSEILDFQDPRNKTLGTSLVYKIRTQPEVNEAFVGVLVIPAHQVERLKAYFQSFVSQGKIHIHELAQIENIQTSTSLYLYQATQGWRNISRKEFRKLLQQLKGKIGKENPISKTREYPFYITPRYKRQWNYLDHPQVHQAIGLYCKPREFSYKCFPFDYTNTYFSTHERNLLRWFHRNNVVRVSCELDRVIHDFSKDYYVIRLPTLPFPRFMEFFKYVPFSRIFHTKDQIYLLTLLNAELVKWITRLNWTVLSVIMYHTPTRVDNVWFDPERRCWKSPISLTT